jgi:multicomponent Na+:H+ antiporter subunit E
MPIARPIGFFVFWLTLYGSDLAAIPLGLATAAGATWISLRLIPRGTHRPSPMLIFQAIPRFLYQSAAAGIDVARRTFAWDMRLRPGFITVPLRLPPGPARGAFRTVMSLLPGSMPCGDDDGPAVQVHCLDTRDPVAAQMQREETHFIRAFGLCPNA